MKLIGKIKRKLGIREAYRSETSKVRHLVTPYCVGYGCDLGFGGDKIVKTKCDGIDLPQPYAYTGKDKVDIACDMMKEPIPVPDNRYDYVYSSHLIEDFDDTAAALKEFVRILKSGGHLILVFPDQQSYEQYCLKTNQPVNQHHKHAEMGLTYMKNALSSLQGIRYETLFSCDREIDYNVILVVKIKKYGKS